MDKSMKSIIATICEKFQTFNVNNVNFYVIEESNIDYKIIENFCIINGRAFEIFTNNEGFKAINLNNNLEKFLFTKEFNAVEESLEFYEGISDDPEYVSVYEHYNELYSSMNYINNKYF